MRGMDETGGSLLSYGDLENRIPLRKIRQVVNDALASLDAEFERLMQALAAPPWRPGG